MKPSNPIARDLQRIWWLSLLQSLAAGVIGLLAGLALAAGYLADLPAWLR